MFGKGNLQPGPKGTQNLWLTPFDPKVLGGLRGQVNQYADTTGTILTPKQKPSIAARQSFSYITTP